VSGPARSLPVVAAPRSVVAILVADAAAWTVLLVLVFLLPGAIGPSLAGHPDRLPFSAAFALFAAAAAWTSLASVGLRARAMTWRRRLGLVLLLAVVWTGTPYDGTPFRTFAVLETGLVWVALLQAGKRVSQAVMAATGAESLHDFE
jgi:hypothetical protein